MRFLFIVTGFLNGFLPVLCSNCFVWTVRWCWPTGGETAQRVSWETYFAYRVFIFRFVLNLFVWLCAGG